MSGTSPTAGRAAGLATLLVGDDQRARRTVLPAVGHAAGALQLGVRSVSGLVSAAARVARPQPTLRPTEWEQELVRLRYAAWDAAPGPTRARALDAYRAQIGKARRALGARSPQSARARVDAVLRLEQRLLAGRRLTSGERAAAQRAVARGLADIAGRPLS